jgi:hypothetical protein
MKSLLIVTFLLMPFLWMSCEAFRGATPIPHDKEAFIGKWESKSGFTIDIKASGVADISHNLSQADADYERLCIKVGPHVIKEIFVKFERENTLVVSKPMVYSKVYKVEQQPYEEDNQWKMVLNGVTFVKQ